LNHGIKFLRYTLPESGDAREGAADKQPSGFASADVFGATPPKEGAEYTIKITAIDPDTREAEFTVVQGGGEEETQAPESSPAPEAESADATPQDGGMI